MANIEGLLRGCDMLIEALVRYASLMMDVEEGTASPPMSASLVPEEVWLDAEAEAWDRLETVAKSFVDDLETFLDKRRTLREKML